MMHSMFKWSHGIDYTLFSLPQQAKLSLEYLRGTEIKNLICEHFNCEKQEAEYWANLVGISMDNLYYQLHILSRMSYINDTYMCILVEKIRAHSYEIITISHGRISWSYSPSVNIKM